MLKKSFPICVVLTCASKYAFFDVQGVFWMNDLLDQMLPVCNFMTQSSNWNHDVPRITSEIKPYIIEQHPWIGELEARLVAMDNDTRRKELPAMIVEIKTRYGEELELIPMHPEDHVQIDDPREAWKANFDMEADFTEIKLDDIENKNDPPPYGEINW